ncbi:hypothetical protein ROLI_009500 [Roseobacter fucihabitans]|uniref:Uncharacterized protein n=1 Tax=Roseobacter fucihabitans TaxID=1537242 RepID=A0ABZ2BRM2_9RHOB|nr:hypothetical protein [Roseobacter litoralis]MBC6966699.1 hypothetical protein [Roseobacter litoralis]
MISAGLLSDALILGPAIWACSYLLRSRWYERQADQLAAQGRDAQTLQLKREEARYFQDFARVMPNWMLAALTIGLGLRLALTVAAIWGA